MAKVDATYKHRGVTFRRVPSNPALWEILDDKGGITRTSISRGALCRGIIDALLDGETPPIDPGKKTMGMAGSGEPPKKWVAAPQKTFDHLDKDELARWELIIRERVERAEAAAVAKGSKIVLVDNSDVPKEILEALRGNR